MSQAAKNALGFSTDDDRPIVCAVCDSRRMESLGPILHPSPPRVAGVPIDLGATQFHLLRCGDCGYQFKHPPIPPQALLACYERASATHWQDRPNPRKRRFDILRKVIEAASRGRRILDVGCFNGAVLEYLGERWQRFGVEPSAPAAEVARQRGVTILGRTIDEIPPDAPPFDVVLMLDLIEHVADPRRLLAQVRQRLSVGGTIVIGTGDTDAWTWRMQRGRYWYCSLPEHVGFFCRKTMDALAAGHGLRVERCLRSSHIRSSAPTVWRQTVVNLAYELAWRSGGFGLPALRRRLARTGAPSWRTAGDHMLLVMRAT
jgi:SAM-dependent methyltransferase